MKTLYCTNSELLDILVANGVDLVCNENMQIVVSEEDANKIETIVAELALASLQDYAIEDI